MGIKRQTITLAPIVSLISALEWGKDLMFACLERIRIKKALKFEVFLISKDLKFLKMALKSSKFDVFLEIKGSEALLADLKRFWELQKVDVF